MLVSNHSTHRKAISFLLFLVMSISWFSVPPRAYATGESITTSSGTSTYVAGTGVAVIDPDLEITGSAANISRAQVYLSAGFDKANDRLIYPTQIGNITGSYTSASGILLLSGTDSLSNYQAALRSIQYENTSAAAVGDRSVVFSIETGNMYSLGNHYYEVVYVSSTITWKNAKASAAALSYNGMTGYLATITSKEENDFLDEKVNADAWIGASDDFNEINTVTGTGTTFTTQNDTEGKWYWVTGPEKGTLISTGNVNPTTISGVYSNWANGEPNNMGPENWAHMLSSGKWNDYPNSLNVHYYIVEYSTTGAMVSPSISTKFVEIVQPGVELVSLSASPSSIAENGGTSTITATLNTTTNQAVTVNLSFDGTATVNSDYTSSGAVITIPANSTTGSVTVTSLDNASDASDKTIVVEIASVINASENGTQQVTITIADDESAPGAPTNVSAAAGNGQATISFDPPSSSGGAVISSYIVTASPGGITASGIGSPITFTGLANGTSYTFTVVAVNSFGQSPSSSESAPVTPAVPPSRSRSVDPNAVTSTINGQSVQIGTRTTETNGEQTQTVLNVNPTTISNLANTLPQGSTLVLPTYTGTANGSKVGMTLGLVDQLFHQDIALQIDTGQIAYTLPANSIDIPTLLTKFEGNVPESQVKFDITISDVPTKMLEVVQNTAAKDEFAIVIPPVEFNVTATYNGQTLNVTQFSQHVSREIALPAGIDPEKISTAIVVKEDGTTYHVPTDVYQKEGQWYARISSLTNSVYTLIYNEATFADTKGRWFETPVAEAASRTILNGYADGTFRGTNPITRAEFAAMIVNTLGLDRVGTSNYPDVKDSNWFYGVVSRASEYKVVSGRLNGNFDPNAYITRQEAMIMMQRAGEICGLVPGEGNAAAALSNSYADQAAISTWAREAVEYNLNVGLMKGSNGQLKPRDNITRAEAAVTILRLLQKSHLIDPRSAV